MGLELHPNLNALRLTMNVVRTQQSLSGNLERLSSGDRLSSSSADPGGLATSHRLRAETRALQQAARSIGDGLSMAQAAEGALNQSSDVLIRMRELASQSANGTLRDEDRARISTEFNELRAELDRISETTEFAGHKLLGGDFSAGVSFAAGVDSSGGDVRMAIPSVRASLLGTATLKLDAAAVGSQADARAALTVLDAAQSQVSTTRGSLGAAQNRFSLASLRLGDAAESSIAADQRIRDTDVARETAELARNQMLSQAGVSVLGQANQLPQMALSLLRS